MIEIMNRVNILRKEDKKALYVLDKITRQLILYNIIPIAQSNLGTV